MQDNVTISTFQLFEMFPNQESARKYLESRLWPDGVKCPFCEQKEKITARKKDFSVRTGTIFERSHIPLHKWLYGMYLLVTARKGISSLQLSKEIGITQKSAWFMLHRLREACGKELPRLRGVIELDETYIGGKESNKHESKKLKSGRGAVGKTPVLGMREKKGKTVAMPISDVGANTLSQAIIKHIMTGSTLHTDDAPAYGGIGEIFYKQKTVNHSKGEYSKDGITINGVESVWAVLKRGLHGVYHHISPKKINRLPFSSDSTPCNYTIMHFSCIVNCGLSS